MIQFIHLNVIWGDKIIQRPGILELHYHYIRGENLLFADADGATTFPDLVKLEEAMEGLAKDGQVLLH